MKQGTRASQVAFVIAMFVIGAGALWLRLSHLDARPMHTDEAVHALKLRDLLRGQYRYDPHEFHGPTLLYFTLPLLRINSASDIADINETTLRLVPALFGVGLIVLLLLLRDGLRAPALLYAALLTAISPAMSYYARYYIQETLLVFFSFATVVALWRYVQSGKTAWCLVAGACLGLMHATKETWILSLFAMLPATGLAALWTRRIDGLRVGWIQRLKTRPILGALALGCLVSVLCYSTFLRHPQGVLDSFKAYATYLSRGGGDSIHVHPWNYYLSILAYFRNGPGPWWSEALILVLFVIGALASLWRHGTESAWASHVAHPGLARFLTFYTLLLAITYAVLPYKTPWCLLGFLQSGILVAGIGALVCVRAMPGRVLKTAMAVLLVAATVQLTNQAMAANSPRFAADRRNPYVYAHSSTDVADFGRQMEDIAASIPNGHQMLVAIVAPDAWPLPWYLRRFKNVGFWNDANDPALKAALPEAGVVIASTDLQPAVQKLLRAAKSEYSYQEQTRSLRPTVFFAANIRDDIWQAFLKRQETSRANAGETP
ncbi:MAG TPA: flippase activity-associated protein Agl23 [Abditibacteriaceae bacterium]|jgi:uncharacterized protein (TIGR03663 family)